ncbi:hypothetical protein PI124_g12353 [Phytophthora idaei]|nr:hypothetical protein PI125_g11928 [Phytophthora idaei]KAG3242832.1 hypothetical protein PI124_g12353 [Phytophthora idaei]
MISPLKDIVVATVLGIGAGMVWNNFKDGELDRISRFYKCSSLLFIGRPNYRHVCVACLHGQGRWKGISQSSTARRLLPTRRVRLMKKS